MEVEKSDLLIFSRGGDEKSRERKLDWWELN